jgi:hypothetical protein
MNLSNNSSPIDPPIDETILGSILSRKSYPNSIQRHLPFNNRWKNRYFVIKKSEILSIISSGKECLYSIYMCFFIDPYRCMLLYVHICIYIYIRIYIYILQVYIYICIYICTYICIYIDIHIYIFRYTIEFKYQ